LNETADQLPGASDSPSDRELPSGVGSLPSSGDRSERCRFFLILLVVCPSQELRKGARRAKEYLAVCFPGRERNESRRRSRPAGHAEVPIRWSSKLPMRPLIHR